MDCIFCKIDTTNSKSIEHIIPESLGNKKNFLPKGIVCDKCNNYFATKLENPLLSSGFFKLLRSQNWIESKKGKIPIEDMWLNTDNFSIEINVKLHRLINGIQVLNIPEQFVPIIMEGTSKIGLQHYINNIPQFHNRLLSRFLGKIAIEALAQLLLEQKADLSLLNDDIRLSPLRNFVRFNDSNREWPYHVRKLYDENEMFFYKDKPDAPVDVLYEYQHYFVDEEMYLIVIIKGYEFAFNMGGSSIDSYTHWLKENNDECPISKGRII